MAKYGIKGNVAYPPTFNNDSGGNDMDKYATKEELNHVRDLLSEKIDHRSDVTDEKISSLEKGIQSNSKVLYWILGIFGTLFTGTLLAILGVILNKL